MIVLCNSRFLLCVSHLSVIYFHLVVFLFGYVCVCAIAIEWMRKMVKWYNIGYEANKLQFVFLFSGAFSISVLFFHSFYVQYTNNLLDKQNGVLNSVTYNASRCFGKLSDLLICQWGKTRQLSGSLLLLLVLYLSIEDGNCFLFTYKTFPLLIHFNFLIYCVLKRITRNILRVTRKLSFDMDFLVVWRVLNVKMV